MFSTHKTLTLALFLLGPLLLLALFGSLLSPWPYDYVLVDNVRAEPLTSFNITTVEAAHCHWVETPLEWGCTIYLLGGDIKGRDLWSRIVWALRPALIVGVGGALSAGLLGLPVGLLAGLCRQSRWQWLRLGDTLFEIVSQAAAAFPALVIVVFVRLSGSNAWQLQQTEALTYRFWALANADIYLMLAAAALTGWPHAARIIRLAVLRGQVRPGRSRGAVFPAGAGVVLRPLAAATVTLVPVYIFFESALSFIGQGMLGTRPSLGGIIGTHIAAIKSRPFLFWSPGVFLLWLLLAFQLLAAAAIVPGTGRQILATQGRLPSARHD